jgi:3-hydroxyacyl-[acyl-carrier-protein] dehydratase
MNNMMKSIESAALTPMVVGEDQSAGRKFSFGEEFIGFSGHFPGFPIVPAIVQIQIAQLLIEGCVGAPLKLQVVERAKFLVPLRPDQEIDVNVCPCAGLDGHAYRVKLTVEEQVAASFILRLQRQETVK